jgi:CBS domain-containing membrane protein
MAADVMMSKVASVSPSTPIKMAARLLVENKYGCLPVIEGDRIIGIITESDFVEFVADNAERFEDD